MGGQDQKGKEFEKSFSKRPLTVKKQIFGRKNLTALESY